MKQPSSRPLRKLLGVLCSATVGISAGAAANPLEELVVTAQKREQSLLEVPISVSAFSGDALLNAGVEGVADLEFSIPSLVVAENSGSAMIATAFVTRGIGINGNIPYFEPSTALFVDGAFRSRSALGLDDLVNIDRIEYLRGPQSTLYGRNASAGVLSIYTQRPRETWGGFIDATASIEDVGEEPFGVLVRGEASGPLSDTSGGGLSFTYRDVDDLFTVTGSPEIDSLNDQRSVSLRGQLQFDPTERLSIRVTGGMADRQRNGPSNEYFWDPIAVGGLLQLLEDTNDVLRLRQAGVDLDGLGAPPGTNDQLDFLLSLGVQPTPEGVTIIPPHNDPFDRKIHQNSPKRNTLRGQDVVVDLEFELAGGLLLNAVSSYNSFKTEDTQDIDQLTLNVGLFNERQEGTSYSQELRLSSPVDGGGIDWIVGAFYLRDEMERRVAFALGPDSPLFGVGINGDTGFFEGDLDTDSISGFTQLSWRPLERLGLSAGVRWIYERKSGTKQNSSFGFGGGPASPVFTGGAFGALFDSADSGDARRSTSDVAYSFNASYDLTDNMIVYGLHSRGIKSGGFNVVWGSIGPGDEGFEFEDETVLAWELGAKATLLDGRMQFSSALFTQSHRDYQTAAFVGTIFSLSNADRARTRGIEADLLWAPTDRVTAGASVAFIDAEYRRFPNGPCHQLATPDANGFCDQSGFRLPFVSDWSANVHAEYRQPVAVGELRFRGEVAMAGDYNPDLVLAPFLEQDGYTHVNVRAGWSNDHWDVTAFVNNLTGENIVDWAGAPNVIPASASGQFTLRAYRNYGLTVRRHF
jgi:iron complex outermembrane receptor protein